MPQVCDEIFKRKTEIESSGTTKMEVTYSMMEIYNEKIRDLLNPNPKTNNDLRVRNGVRAIPVAGADAESLPTGPALDRAVHNGGDSGGVIASVFQPFQAVDQPGNDGSIAGDADDAAHALGTPKRKETEGRRFALAAIRG